MIASACMTWNTENPGRLSEFYRHALGWELRLSRGDWVELEGPGRFRLALRRREGPDSAAGRGRLGLESEMSLESAARHLRECGATIDGAVEKDEEAGVEILEFRDPEGNGAYLWRLLDRKGDPGAA